MSAPKRVHGTFAAGSRHMVGDGFDVRNLFPSNDLGERLSPFLLLDYSGPTDFTPTDAPRGVGEHPHRGFETVTIVHRGRVAHRDSTGASGVIGPGDVQWMTAGSGVVHEERHEREFARSGGTLQLVQLWVNLPRAHKRTAPRYQDVRDADVPRIERGGATVRVIAGELDGVRGPARTFSPVEVWDIALADGARLDLEVPDGHNAGVVVLEGAASVNGSPEAGEAAMVWLDPEGTGVRIEAAGDTRALLLGGAPLGEPVVSHGPFVMNTPDEIVEAIRDYQSGRMGRLD